MSDQGEQEPQLQDQQNLADYLEQHSEVGNTIFQILNIGVNELLAGSDYHPRYQSTTEVGLAVAVAKVDRSLYFDDINPLGWYTPSGSDDGSTYYNYINTSQEILAFKANNRDCTKPETWAWKTDKDSEILGGELLAETLEVGRFTVYATAKINALKDQPNDLTSHSVSGENVGEGKVGFAGAKTIDKGANQSIVATSGLWDVHDHIVAAVFAQAVTMHMQGEDYDQIERFCMEELDVNFRSMQEMLEAEGKKPENLTREEVNGYIRLIEESYASNLAQAA